MCQAVGGSADLTQRAVRSAWIRRVRAPIPGRLVLVLPIWITVVIVSVVFRLMREASIWFIMGVLLSPLTTQPTGD